MSAVIRIIILTTATLLCAGVAVAQSAEYYAGHKRTGVDLMWFKNFKNKKGKNTAFLFFSRNRASVDYHHSPSGFGSTNAISYNFKNGLAIVAVASFLNAGVTAKAGIQYYRQQKDFLFFGWLVADLKEKGNIDLFGLFRYQPLIGKHWRAFGQLELFPVYTPGTAAWNLTQRIRLGAKYERFAFGAMADFNQAGKTNFTSTENIGGFLRYEF